MAVLEVLIDSPIRSLPQRKEALSELNKTPELVIPPRLSELIDPRRIVATPYTFSMGSWLSDNCYDVDLAVLISQKLDAPYSGMSVNHSFSWAEIQQNPEIKELHWRQTLERHRNRVVTAGKIDENHKPLLSLLAHSPDQLGVEVLTFVVNHELQGQGIGSSFYRNFEKLLRERGYHYLTGSHSVSTRPDFFFSLPGMRRTSDLNPLVAKQLRLTPDPHQSIKFLNDQFEDII